MKRVGSDEEGRIESCPIQPAGDPWQHSVITGGRSAIQENNHGPFPPSVGTPKEPAINDVVLLVFTRERRGKCEMSLPIKFDPRRIAGGGKKVRAVQEFERFGQSPF